MKVWACRICGEYDLRLEEMDFWPAGRNAVVVELGSNIPGHELEAMGNALKEEEI